MAGRYGAPHKEDPLENGGSVWTYYERSSATASYAGYAGRESCRAYVLTFDEKKILRQPKRCQEPFPTAFLAGG